MDEYMSGSDTSMRNDRTEEDSHDATCSSSDVDFVIEVNLVTSDCEGSLSVIRHRTETTPNSSDTAVDHQDVVLAEHNVSATMAECSMDVESCETCVEHTAADTLESRFEFNGIRRTSSDKKSISPADQQTLATGTDISSVKSDDVKEKSVSPVKRQIEASSFEFSNVESDEGEEKLICHLKEQSVDSSTEFSEVERVDAKTEFVCPIEKTAGIASSCPETSDEVDDDVTVKRKQCSAKGDGYVNVSADEQMPSMVEIRDYDDSESLGSYDGVSHVYNQTTDLMGKQELNVENSEGKMISTEDDGDDLNRSLTICNLSPIQFKSSTKSTTVSLMNANKLDRVYVDLYSQSCKVINCPTDSHDSDQFSALESDACGVTGKIWSDGSDVCMELVEDSNNEKVKTPTKEMSEDIFSDTSPAMDVEKNNAFINEQLLILNSESSHLNTSIHKSACRKIGLAENTTKCRHVGKKQSTPKKAKLGGRIRKPVKRKLEEFDSTELVAKKKEYSTNPDSDSDSTSNLQIDEENIDDKLEKNAEASGLTATNVKNILHHLITNDDVVNMVKNSVMEGMTGEEKDMVEAAFEPKMTRAAVRKAVELGQVTDVWPMSPLKKKKTKPSILDIDFPEDEDDDEYNPENDAEAHESDDDESMLSSQVSEYGSPCPLTPSTPSSNLLPVSTNSPLLSQEKIISPLNSSPDIAGCSVLGQQFRQAMESIISSSVVEEQNNGTIAERTRSKLPLKDTSLIAIEEALCYVAPDITPDMYDTYCDDSDWQEFIRSLIGPEFELPDPVEVVDDESVDPEYDYLAEADTVVTDPEDFRFDRPFRVSKKELNELIDELHLLFPEQDDDDDRIECSPQETAPKPTTVAEMARSEVLSPNLRVSLEQKLIIEDHMRKHIQLASQMYVLCSGSEDYQSMVPSCVQILRELELFRTVSVAGVNSSFNVCNLPPALELIDAEHNWNITKEVEDLSHDDTGSNATDSDVDSFDFHKSKNAFKKAVKKKESLLRSQKELVWNSAVFLYPHLMMQRRLLSQDEALDSRTMFTPGEDNLIALGMEQFLHLPFYCKFIQKYMMPCKSVSQIAIRIKNLCTKKAVANSVKYFRRHKKVPEFPYVVDHFTSDRMKAPKDQDQCLLPAWCKRYRDFLRKESRTSGKLLMSIRKRSTSLSVGEVNELSEPERSCHSAPGSPAENKLTSVSVKRKMKRSKENTRLTVEDMNKDKPVTLTSSARAMPRVIVTPSGLFIPIHLSSDITHITTSTAPAHQDSGQEEMQKEIGVEEPNLTNSAYPVSVKGMFNTNPAKRSRLTLSTENVEAKNTHSLTLTPGKAAKQMMGDGMLSSEVSSHTDINISTPASSANHDVSPKSTPVGSASSSITDCQVSTESASAVLHPTPNVLPASLPSISSCISPASTDVTAEALPFSEHDNSSSSEFSSEVIESNPSFKNSPSKSIKESQLVSSENATCLNAGDVLPCAKSMDTMDISVVETSARLDGHSIDKPSPKMVDDSVVDPSSRPDNHSAVDLSTQQDSHSAVYLSTQQDSHSAVDLSTQQDSHSAVDLSTQQNSHSAVYLSTQQDSHSAVDLSTQQNSHSAVYLSSNMDDSSVEPSTGLDGNSVIEPSTGLDSNSDFQICTGLDDNSVKSTGLDDNSVKSTGLNDNSVKSTGLDDNSVKSTGLDDNSVKSSTGLDDNSVKSSTGLDDNSVKSSTGLDDNSVKSSTGLDDNSVKLSTGQDDNSVKLSTGQDDNLVIKSSSGLDDNSFKSLIELDGNLVIDLSIGLDDPSSDERYTRLGGHEIPVSHSLSICLSEGLNSAYDDKQSEINLDNALKKQLESCEEIIQTVTFSKGSDNTVTISSESMESSDLRLENTTPTFVYTHSALQEQAVTPSVNVVHDSVTPSTSREIIQNYSITKPISSGQATLIDPRSTLEIIAVISPYYAQAVLNSSNTKTHQQSILEKTPTKKTRLKPIKPKAIRPSLPTVSPFLEKIHKSPKRAQLQKQARSILPKGFYVETKVSPTKIVARGLKRRAQMFVQRTSPCKLLPKTDAQRSPLSVNLRPSETKRKRVTKKQKKKSSSKVYNIDSDFSDEQSDVDDSTLFQVDNFSPHATPKESIFDIDSKLDESDEMPSDDAATLSQDDSIDDLMAASTTIRFQSRNQKVLDSNNLTKTQKKRELLRAMLDPDLLEIDPRKDEKDTAFAAAYLKRAKDMLSDNMDIYEHFLRYMYKFGKGDLPVVKLYNKVQRLFKDFPEIAMDFAAFLSPHQAITCGCFMANDEFIKARRFLRHLELNFADKHKSQFYRVLMAFHQWFQRPKKWTSDLKAAVYPLIKGMPYLLDEFYQFFSDDKPPDSNGLNYEVVNVNDSDLEADAEIDSAEEIDIPQDLETYRTKRCRCNCHYNTLDIKLQLRLHHCYSCSLRVIQGKLYYQTSSKKITPVNITFHKPKNVSPKPSVAHQSDDDEETDFDVADKENINITSRPIIISPSTSSHTSPAKARRIKLKHLSQKPGQKRFMSLNEMTSQDTPAKSRSSTSLSTRANDDDDDNMSSVEETTSVGFNSLSKNKKDRQERDIYFTTFDDSRVEVAASSSDFQSRVDAVGNNVCDLPESPLVDISQTACGDILSNAMKSANIKQNDESMSMDFFQKLFGYNIASANTSPVKQDQGGFSGNGDNPVEMDFVQKLLAGLSSRTNSPEVNQSALELLQRFSDVNNSPEENTKLKGEFQNEDSPHSLLSMEQMHKFLEEGLRSRTNSPVKGACLDQNNSAEYFPDAPFHFSPGFIQRFFDVSNSCNNSPVKFEKKIEEAIEEETNEDVFNFDITQFTASEDTDDASEPGTASSFARFDENFMQVVDEVDTNSLSLDLQILNETSPTLNRLSMFCQNSKSLDVCAILSAESESSDEAFLETETSSDIDSQCSDVSMLSDLESDATKQDDTKQDDTIVWTREMDKVLLLRYKMTDSLEETCKGVSEELKIVTELQVAERFSQMTAIIESTEEDWDSDAVLIDSD